MKSYLVLSTIDSAETAQQIATQLVEEQLAACLNIISDVMSIYKWKGTVERESEQLMVIKTAGDRLEDLIARLTEIHPYEVPEVIALPIEQGHNSYLQWIVAETRR